MSGPRVQLFAGILMSSSCVVERGVLNNCEKDLVILKNKFFEENSYAKYLAIEMATLTFEIGTTKSMSSQRYPSTVSTNIAVGDFVNLFMTKKHL